MARRWYTDEGLRKLEAEYAGLFGPWALLKDRLIAHKFSDQKAREFALQGFGRRFDTLARCVQNVFRLIPPELEGVPTSEEAKDAAIQVQSFVINVFGALDNLAWVWVLERNVKKPNGAPVPPEWIGLRPPNTFVRKSLSPGLQAYLDGMPEWFEYQEGYRHALAHRIPLYIPPYAIDPKDQRQFDDLENEITRAIFQSDYDKADALRQQRDGLKFFRPFIMHSWVRAKPFPFHVQMIADVKTIEAICTKLWDDLSAVAP